MANRVTNEDILRINESYYRNKTYAATAREVGFSAGTVKKYVISGWKPVEKESIKHFDMSQLPDFTGKAFEGLSNFGDLCNYSGPELLSIEKLKEELSV